MKNNMARIIAGLLVIALVLSFVVPVFAAETGDTVFIRSAEDLIVFAKNCTLDTWSQGKTVELQEDISLNDVDFEPIPTFGGTFNGNGHAISGLEIVDSVTPAGLFSQLQREAVVQNLHVSGTVKPSGSAENAGGIVGVNYGTVTGCTFTGNVEGKLSIGGIAGINETDGKIENCSVNGSVIGKTMTGGIAGFNAGTIISSNNRAYINTQSADPAISLEDLNLESSLDLNNLASLDTVNAAKDTGGIAGYSSGTIRSCTNQTVVGYPHIGYNVGGIVGRNCGYIELCENEAYIYGRKDVGGIVGQIEPDMILVLSEDYLETLSEQLQELSELVQDVGYTAGGAGNAIQSDISAMKSYIASAQSAVAALKPGKEPSLPDLGSLNQLVSAVRGMKDTAERMTNTVSNGTGAVVSSVTAVSDQVGAIAETVSAIVDGVKQAPVVDSSDTSLEDVTEGKVYACRNIGSIQGDINIGGIVGTMALEYEVDPEDDLTAEITGTQRRNYEMKAVVQSCINEAVVESKRNCVGGICGRMDLGLLVDCENYGNITSGSGDYVGGIAGLTGGTVRSCFAKCTLSGDCYVGGIVGSGITEDIGGTASFVEGCYSMVAIANASEYYGAVSGADTGIYVLNYFVSDSLAGINRMSFSGRAEPMEYDQLLGLNKTVHAENEEEGELGETADEPESVPVIPEAFLKLNLTFVADEEVIATIPFDYGASFDNSIYPEIPAKDGYHASWDTEELLNLRFDTVVSAVYEPYITVLTSEEARSSGRPVFLVLGQYDGDQTVLASALATTPADFAEIPQSAWDFIRKSFTTGRISHKVAEQWSVSVPDDGKESHTIRYLPAEGKPEDLDVYIKDGDGWTKLETGSFGSYLTFQLDGTNAEIAILSNITVWWMWVIAAVIGLVLLIALVRLIKKLAKPKKKVIPEEVSEEDVPVRTPPTMKEMKRRKWLSALLILLAFLVGIAAAAAFFLFPEVKTELESVNLVKAMAERDTICMDLSVNAKAGNQELDFSLQAQKLQAEGKPVTVISQENITLVYTDGTVILENGKAFRVDDAHPDYTKLLDVVIRLNKNVEFSKDRETYTLTAKGQNAKDILSLLLPSCGASLSGTHEVAVVLKTEDSQVSSVTFTASGTLGEEDNRKYAIEAILVIDPEDFQELSFPANIRNMLSSGSYEAEILLTDDLLELAGAWKELEARQQISANLTLDANCGPLVVSEKLKFYRWNTQPQISSVQKNGYALYFTDTVICDKSGKKLPLADAPTVEAADLLDIAYRACMNAELSCAVSGKERTFTVSLDEKGMQDVAAAIAPEASQLGIAFEHGSVQFVIRDGKIQSIQVFCDGTMQVVITDVSVSFRGELVFPEGSTESAIPEAVTNTLK